jgi:hypothetical protein
MADTWDGQEDNEPSFIPDWVTAERIATTGPVAAQLVADIDALFTAEDAAGESAHILNRGRILFRAMHQLNMRG